MNLRKRRFFLVSSLGGSGGGVISPNVALQLVGSDWTVVSGNLDPADGFFVLNGSNEVELVQGAVTGLGMSLDTDGVTVILTAP